MNKGNPWKSIALSDYEGHMSLDGVRQLQEMNRIMQGQFQKVLQAVRPGYVSCVIQVNEGDGFVSDSPYLHAFDRLSEVHHEMDEAELTQAMEEKGYRRTAMAEYPLPNGKKLVRLDYTA